MVVGTRQSCPATRTACPCEHHPRPKAAASWHDTSPQPCLCLQLQAQEAMQQALCKERRQQQCRADELQEQLQHATERASALELAGAVLQQQLNSSQRAVSAGPGSPGCRARLMAADPTLAIATGPGAAKPQPATPQEPAGDRGTGAAGAAAAVPGPAPRGPAAGEWPQGRAQPLTPAVAAAVTGGCSRQATHHEAALGRLQEALQAAEARAGQSQVAAMETARELQQARASSQQELAAALGQVRKRPLHPRQPRAQAQQTGASSTHAPSRGAPRSSLHPPMHAHTLLQRAHALGPVTPLLPALGPPGQGLGRAVLVPRAVSLLQADVLRSSLEAARADSQRLQRESELVLADVRQWATEQK